jgi:hypothetical protein
MKRLLFLLAIALTGLSQSYAQNKTNPAPHVRLGKIEAAKIVNGKWTPSAVNREELLANSTLIVEGSTCKITGYSFSILPDGHDFMGPFTVTGSAEFTQQIKKLIAGLDYSGGRVFIENIKLNCRGAENTAMPLVFTYK